MNSIKFIIFSSLVLTLSLSFSAHAKAPSEGPAPICMKGTLRWLDWGKTTTQNISYCFNNDRNVLISKNCLRKKCEVYTALKNVADSKMEIFSPVGNPGFNLCNELGGFPQIIEFYDSVEWYKLNRCYFSKDKSFIDTSFLISEWTELRTPKSKGSEK